MLGKTLKLIGATLLAGVVGGAALLAHTLYLQPLSIDWFFDRVFVRFAISNPELLSTIVPHPAGIRYFDRRLTDASVAHETKMAARAARELDILRRYDRAALSPQQQLSYDILETFLQTSVDGRRWLFHDYPINPTAGVQSELPSLMLSAHPLDSEADAASYVARLRGFDRKFTQLLETLELRRRNGLLPPRFVVEKSLQQMRELVTPPPHQNLLYSGFAERLDTLELPPERRQYWLDQAALAIVDSVIPAYMRLIAHMESLLPLAQGNHGVWALPDGDAYYAWAVRRATTSELSPDAIHQLGLAEVARIEAEMEPLLRGQGLSEGSVGQRLAQLARDPQQRYEDSDAGRAQSLRDFQAIIDQIDRGLDPYFRIRPQLGVEVRAIPAFKAATAPGAYYEPGPLDGSRPGVFYVNQRDIGETARFGMRTLAYHEAIPGHHFQITIARELQGLPIFRRVLPFTAYAEGWALYAERLAWEAGFQQDPLDDLGRLQAEMFRAVRLVVDTGLHRQRWTREAALAYLIDKTGMGDTEASAEIERYLVWPGQALAYKLGMLKILELRERARQALGERFDIRDFHDVVLSQGSLPLPILEREVQRWIDASLQAPVQAH